MKTHREEFSRAIADLSACVKTSAKMGPEYPSLFEIATDALRKSEKFYQPEELEIFGNIEFEEHKKNLMLPFPITSILTRQRIGLSGGTSWRETKKITIAIAADSAVKKTSPNVVLTMLSVVYVNGMWILGPPSLAYVLNQELGLGISTPAAGEKSRELYQNWERLSGQTMEKEFSDDLYQVTTLCSLLALDNVKSEKVHVPDRERKTRKRNGDLPLYSYRVLLVAGERWDGTPKYERDSAGILRRSHMRRGHIRKLDENRRVWVRAAFVRGSASGYVDKEYVAAKRGTA